MALPVKIFWDHRGRFGLRLGSFATTYNGTYKKYSCKNLFHVLKLKHESTQQVPYHYICDMSDQINNPLHGITLKTIVTELKDHYGWERMHDMVSIRCFTSNPSINSSLKFLRKTPWARTKVEEVYIRLLHIRKANENSPSK